MARNPAGQTELALIADCWASTISPCSINVPERANHEHQSAGPRTVAVRANFSALEDIPSWQGRLIVQQRSGDRKDRFR